MSAIEISELTQVYGKTTAVKNLSFTLEGGQILGLIGPNGAGKTTTLKVLAGILYPTQGQLKLHGYDVAKDALSARRVTGFIPDSPGCMGFLTVWEHISLTAALYQVKNYEYFACELLAEFELEDKKNKIAKDLSLGMRQKLSICCSYLISPRILLFDEPLTGLDPKGIQTLERSIKEQAAKGVAIVLSSHLLGMLENLCTDALIIKTGESIYFGPLSNLLKHGDVSSYNSSLEDAYFQITQSKR